MSRWVQVDKGTPPVGVPVWVCDGKTVGCSEFTDEWAYCDDVAGPITHWQEFPNDRS